MKKNSMPPFGSKMLRNLATGCLVALMAGAARADGYADTWLESTDASVTMTVLSGGKRAYVFTNTTAAASVTALTDLKIAQYLVVGGGGGGGNTMGGGGGGGGVLYAAKANLAVASNATIAVSVGAGGGPGNTTDWKVQGQNGGNSSFKIGDAEAVLAYGGGGGGSWDAANGGGYGTGSAGGSGGGATRSASGGGATAGQGNAGGNGVGGSNTGAAGGGGGALTAGYTADTTNLVGGCGGDGLTNGITGVSRVYGSGGGAGGSNNSFGLYAGGTGGAGAGDGAKSGKGGNGTDGLGGGGGGGGYSGSVGVGGTGGSGTVILVLEEDDGGLSRCYLRFMFTAGGSMCQISELAFYDANTNRINVGMVQQSIGADPLDIPTNGWSLAKSFTYNGSEGASSLFDANVDTRQCAVGGFNYPNGYTFRFPRGVEPRYYNLATANDSLGLSPTAWYAEASIDGVTWTEIERKSGVSYPSEYKTWWNSGNPYAFATWYCYRKFLIDAIPDEQYRGEPVEPTLTVRDEVTNALLTEDVDYTVVYSNNTTRGTGYAIVSGVADTAYSGIRTVATFNILAPSMSVEVANTVTEGRTPPYTTTVTVRDGTTGDLLVENTQYVLVYSNNAAPGVATVTIVGTNGYVYAAAVSKNYNIGARLRVAADGSAEASGASWDTAVTFSAAIAKLAAAGGEIWMKTGTYTDISASSTTVISNSIDILGGFAGTEATAAARTAGTVSTIDGGNARNLLRFENIDGANLSFERIVFTRAHTRALYKAGAGDLTISGCAFRANGLTISGKPQTSADGRGIYAAGGGKAHVKIIDTPFEYQRASGYEWQGGGMGAYVTACASLTLEDCLFATNGIALAATSAAYAGKFSGAALCVLSTPVTAKNCRFAGNVAAISGGGDYLINGDGVSGKDGQSVYLDGACGGSVFENCSFVGNETWMAYSTSASSPGPHSYGGAVAVFLKNASDTCAFTNCTFAYNLSQGKLSPGGLNVVRGTVTLHDSIVYGNVCGYSNATVGADIDVKANGRLKITYSLLTSTNATEITTSSADNLTLKLSTLLFGDPKFVTSNAVVTALLVKDVNLYRYFNTASSATLGSLDVHFLSIGGYSLLGGGTGPAVTDTSIALDAGDPSASYADEREPNGNRVNLGAYGNTDEASMTPDGDVSIGTIVTDTESDPGTAIYSIPLTGSDTYLADVWFCFGYSNPGGTGTNAWQNVISAGTMQLPGTTLTADLGAAGVYYSKNTMIHWRAFAQTAYGTAHVDGTTTIPYDRGAATPAIASVSDADYDTDVGTAIYSFALGGVGRYSADVYICSGGTGGVGTNGWKEVTLVKSGGVRGDNLTAPIGTYFDEGETCAWRIVVMVDGAVAATRDGTATGIYPLPPYKGKKGPKYVVHVRAGADGNASGSDWYNACTTLAAALQAVANDSTKSEIWILGDLPLSANASIINLGTPCVIRGGFATSEEQSPDDRAAGVRSRVYNTTSSGVQFIRLTATASFGCDRVNFEKSNSGEAGVYVTASGSDTTLSFTNCEFRVNSRLYATGGSAARFAMGGCSFRQNITTGNGTTSYYNALQLSSFAGADIADTAFVTNGLSFTQWTGGDGRDAGNIAYMVMVSGTPTCFTRCTFLGGKATGHNNSQFHGVVGLYGNCGGSAFKNCVFMANGFTLFEAGWIQDKYSAPLVLSFGGTSQTVLIENCTFAYNVYNNLSGCAGISLNNCAATIKNSIFFGNFHTSTSAADLKLFGGATADISYSLFSGTGTNNIAISSGTVTFGEGIVLADPLFVTDLATARAHLTVEPDADNVIAAGGGSQLTNAAHCVSFDVHLKSPAGHWEPGLARPKRSYCRISPGVDAGDPSSDWSGESEPNGHRVNLGCWGNTYESALTPQTGTQLLVR